MIEQRIGYHLEGLSPLIMHWDNIEWADEIDARRTAIKDQDKSKFRAGDDRCPPETWKGYAYNDGNVLVCPTDNLRTCVMKAGATVAFKGNQTFKKIVPAAIVFDELYAEFRTGEKQIRTADIEAIDGEFADQARAVLKLGFRLFVKRAKIGAAKHIRVRPYFSQWTIDGTFLLVDDRITMPIVTQIWERAGLRIGLCDWRPDAPQSPGPYGRFTVILSPSK